MLRAVVARLDADLLEGVGEREALVFLIVGVGVLAPSRRYAFWRSPAPLAEMRTAPGSDLAVSSLIVGHDRAGDERLQPARLRDRNRQLDDARVIDDLADGCGRDVDRRGFARDRNVSDNSPSSSVMFTVRFWFACSAMSVRRTDLKPVSSARISYVVGRSMETISARSRPHRFLPDTGRGFDGGHRGAWNHAAAAIGQRAVDLPAPCVNVGLVMRKRGRNGKTYSTHLDTPSSKGESGRREKVGGGKCRTTPWSCPAKSVSRSSPAPTGRVVFLLCSGEIRSASMLCIRRGAQSQDSADTTYCDMSLIIAAR